MCWVLGIEQCPLFLPCPNPTSLCVSVGFEGSCLQGPRLPPSCGVTTAACTLQTHSLSPCPSPTPFTGTPSPPAGPHLGPSPQLHFCALPLPLLHTTPCRPKAHSTASKCCRDGLQLQALGWPQRGPGAGDGVRKGKGAAAGRGAGGSCHMACWEKWPHRAEITPGATLWVSQSFRGAPGRVTPLGTTHPVGFGTATDL